MTPAPGCRRRGRCPTLAVAGAAVFAACTGEAGPREASMSPAMSAEEVAELHDRVLTIDTHDDIPFDFATDEVDPFDADRQRRQYGIRK